MKKLLAVLPLLAVAFLVAPSLASADVVQCGQVDPATNLVRDCGNGNPGLIGMPWGLTGDQTPKFTSGTSVPDGYGHVLSCPWFFPAGCYDISKTQYFRDFVLPWLPKTR